MTQKKEYINFDSTDRKFMLFDITLDVNLLIPEKICDKGVVYLWMFLLVIFFQISQVITILFSEFAIFVISMVYFKKNLLVNFF